MKMSAKRQCALEQVYRLGQISLWGNGIDKRSLNWLDANGFISIALNTSVCVPVAVMTEKGLDYLKQCY